MLNFIRPLQANGNRKSNYKVDNIVINQPLGNISKKQNINKLTKLSTNQQYKIPQPLGKMSLEQPQTNWLDPLQAEENRTSSVIHSPTFSKQSISEIKFERHTIAKLKEQTNITASQSTFPSYEQISSSHTTQEQTLTPHERAYNDFNQQPAHEIFKILEDLQQSSI